MIFETAQNKPAKINGNSSRGPLQRNAAPAKPVTNIPNASKPPVKPVQRSSTPARTAMPQQRSPVRSAGYTQIKKAPVSAANVPQRKPYPVTAARPTQKVPTSSVKPNPVQTRKVYRYAPAERRVMQPINRRVYYYPRTVKPGPSASTNQITPRKTYRGPLVVRRAQQIPGRRVYYPGRLINQPYYSTSYTRPPVNANIPVNTPGRYVPGYGYCIPQSTGIRVPAAASGNQQASTSVVTTIGAKKPVCHTCGLRTKGCTTLSRFAHNSAQLNATHKRQIREMALNMLRNHANAIIATGHTDKSGSNSFNKALGARRAGAVIRELRKQLSVLKPNAHKNLLWKIVTRGEERPISRTDAAANRRVHLCVRKVRPAA